MEASATGSLITVNIDGKPLEKLIEVVSNGIGTLYRPRKIRKEADAQAYAIKVLEKAKAEGSADAMLIEVDTAERIGQRMVAQEIRRQNNIDTVVEAAAEDLNGKEVSDEPVNEDWATRFFGIVQDVSQKEMKAIWAKILAKEIERPSSYSMRTLEVLRNISFAEAELFVKLSEFVLKNRGCFVFNDEDILDKYGLQYRELATLREAGLLQTGELVTRTYSATPGDTKRNYIVYGDKIIVLSIPPESQAIKLTIYLLSQAGCELFELTEHKENMNYIKDLAAFIKKKNPAATVEYGKILETDDLQVRYETPLTTL